LIYVDTSVVLAHLLSETTRPPPAFWAEDLVTSRLLAYEAWTRVNALSLGASHGEALRETLGHMHVLELSRPMLAGALEPFPVPVRTLDALHLASIVFLQSLGCDVELASYDERMTAAACRLDVRTRAP
jgi:hypothetical protein